MSEKKRRTWSEKVEYHLNKLDKLAEKSNYHANQLMKIADTDAFVKAVEDIEENMKSFDDLLDDLEKTINDGDSPEEEESEGSDEESEPEDEDDDDEEEEEMDENDVEDLI